MSTDPDPNAPKPNKPLLPPEFIRLWSAIFALCALAAFVSLYGWAFYVTWTFKPPAPTPPAGSSPSPPPASVAGPKIDDRIIWVATGVAGLVGGIVAMAFEVKISTTQPQTRTAILSAMVDTVLPRWDVQQLIAMLYVLAYTAVGIVGAYTWLRCDFPPDLVRNLALTFIGLALAIAKNFFSPGRG